MSQTTEMRSLMESLKEHSDAGCGCGPECACCGDADTNHQCGGKGCCCACGQRTGNRNINECGVSIITESITEYNYGETTELLYVWAHFNNTGQPEPHMTFHNTREGQKEAEREVASLNDAGHEAFIGNEFPRHPASTSKMHEEWPMGERKESDNEIEMWAYFNNSKKAEHVGSYDLSTDAGKDNHDRVMTKLKGAGARVIHKDKRRAVAENSMYEGVDYTEIDNLQFNLDY